MKFLERKYLILCICWLPLLPFNVFAQDKGEIGLLNRVNERYYNQSLSLSRGSLQEIRPGATFTALVFKINAGESFEDSYVVNRSDTFYLKRNEHAPVGEKFTSNMISFDESPTSLQIYNGEIAGKIALHYLNAKPIQQKKSKKVKRSRKQDEECQEPGSIAQSDWRAGLAPPSYSRIFHEVRHLIVHHSAGSNSITNYEQEVRNIYLFHTDVNGWSDIGYNYLIAPDGVIYKGRDPATGEQDNVRGAHYCGKNSNTMGVCLLGTFVDVAPTDEAIASLISVLGWKIEKEGLDPFGSSAHASNSSLGVIAGHRDGCATECPGQMTYDRLPAIKTQTAAFVDACDGVIDPDPDPDSDPVEEVGPFAVYPNPSREGILTIDTGEGTILNNIYMSTSTGKSVDIQTISTAPRQIVLSTTHLTPGLYLLKLIYPDKEVKRRVLVF